MMVIMLQDIKKKEKAGLSDQQLLDKAEQILRTKECCLLVGDIINSGQHLGYDSRKSHQLDFISAIEEFNRIHSEDLPLNDLRNSTPERGASIFSGDSLALGIDKTEWILEFKNHLAKALPKIEFRWSVAKDWYDKEAFKIC